MMQSFTVQQLRLSPNGNQWEPQVRVNGLQNAERIDGFEQCGGIPGEEKQVIESDEFKMYFYKVIPCSKRCCHDWTTCPYAHPGEKAARRDPRLYNYVAQVCADMKKAGRCDSGNLCMYAHNVFEYWLHPTKYRTQLCNDEMGCRRKICFFAHCLDELRVPAAYPRALSQLDTSSGSLQQLPATVRLRDALGQEAKQGPQDGVSPTSTPPPPPPPKTVTPLTHQPSTSSAILSPLATEATMAKTQDLLQQLQLMQALKDNNAAVNVSAMGGELAKPNPKLGLNSAMYSNNLARRSSSNSTNYSPTSNISPLSSFTSDLPLHPPPPPTLNTPTTLIAHNSVSTYGFNAKQFF